jgi:acetyl esterase/lipase
MIDLRFIASFLLLIIFVSSCTSSKRSRNIEYQTLKGKDVKRNKLDVYYPRINTNPTEVFVFIHGGSWASGNKNIYKFIGRRMARKGKVAVIINYRLAEDGQYKDMIADCENALQWTYTNINNYGGDQNKITVSGHSAGGHLAAWTAINNPKDITSGNPLVKNCVLIDAFGLDIYSYLTHYHAKSDSIFMKTFTTSPTEWKAGSPMYHLQFPTVPYLIFYGTKTYPAIQGDSKKYYEQLRSRQSPVEIQTIKGKKHIGMILQMYCGNNILYKKILPFMEK